MNPSLLREYSKNPERSKKLKREIVHACAAVVVALFCVGFGSAVEDQEGDVPIWAAMVLGGVALYISVVLGFLLFYVFKIVELATDTHPHPDRFDVEEQALNRQYDDLRRRRREARGESGGDTQP